MVNIRKQNFLKGSVILMLSAVTAKILGALFKIPLTNILGGIGMSYFSSAYSLFMPVYALSVTGLSSAVARMTAQNVALGMYANAKRVRSTALFLFSGVGLAGSIIILCLARPFSVYSADLPEAWLAVAMISPSVFFGCVTAVERGYYEGLSNMYPTALSQAIEGIVKVFSGLWLCGYVQGHGREIMSYFPEITDVKAISASAGILGVTLSTAGSALFFAVMRIFGDGLSENGEKTVISRKKIIKELIAISLPTGISAVVTNLTALIDMWTVIGCISYYKGNYNISGISSEDLPQFIYGSFSGIALTVFNLVPSVTNMLGKGILPCVTEAWENKDHKSLEKSSLQALLTSVGIAVPSAFGLGVLSEQILIFLFPHQADEVKVCVNALKILMPGMVCLCMSYPVFSMLQAVGKSSSPLKIMLAGTVLKLAGNIILIRFMGIDGASLSTTLCYIMILTVSLSEYVKVSGIKIDFLPFALIGYSGIMCGAGAYLVSEITARYGMSVFMQIALSAVTGGGIYIGIILVCGRNLFQHIGVKKRTA